MIRISVNLAEWVFVRYILITSGDLSVEGRHDLICPVEEEVFPFGVIIECNRLRRWSLLPSHISRNKLVVSEYIGLSFGMPLEVDRFLSFMVGKTLHVIWIELETSIVCPITLMRVVKARLLTLVELLQGTLTGADISLMEGILSSSICLESESVSHYLCFARIGKEFG